MALAKKGSRLITVGSAEYRWTVSADDEPGLGIVVESAPTPASRMVMWVEHGNVVRPKLVRYAILEGLRHGWQPDERGPELRLRISVEPDDRLLPCPCCDYRTLQRRGEYDICPICFWEEGGPAPNHMTLAEGRANFLRLGACDKMSLQYVVPPEQRATFERLM